MPVPSETDTLFLLRLVKLNAQLHERQFQNLNAAQQFSDPLQHVNTNEHGAETC